MMSRLGLGLGSLLALAISFGASEAFAFVAKPLGVDAAPSFVTPAAMCGRTCQSGGRYIQGPPSVCEQYGLLYCGRSRGGPAPASALSSRGRASGSASAQVVRACTSGRRRNCRTTTIRATTATSANAALRLITAASTRAARACHIEGGIDPADRDRRLGGEHDARPTGRDNRSVHSNEQTPFAAFRPTPRHA